MPCEMRVIVNKLEVARVISATFEQTDRMVINYAMQYREEGDVFVEKQVPVSGPNAGNRWRWVNHAKFRKIGD